MVLSLARSGAEALPDRPGAPTRHRAQTNGTHWWTGRDWWSAGIGVIFLAAATAVTGRLWADPYGRSFAVNHTDQTLFEFILLHAQHVFTQGVNPLRTDLLNVPIGVNLMANTSILGLALPLAPLTAWLGPSVVFLLIITLGLAGTAYAWYYLLYRHFVGDRLAAVAGGAICGFGPGMIAHANGHPNLTAQFLVPLILWRAIALRCSTRVWRDGAILAILIVWQTFINEEVLFDTAVAGVLFAAVYGVFRPHTIRVAARNVLAGIGIAVALSACVLAYPLWFQFTAPGHVKGLPLWQQALPYRLTLSSWVTLPQQSWWGPMHDLAGASPAEQNSFLGWPMVIVSVAIVVALWRRSPAVRALAMVGALFAYASLGTRITIANSAESYPYSLWSHLYRLPLFASVLPSRLALVVLPIVGLLVAFAIAHLRRAFRADDAGAARVVPRVGRRLRPDGTVRRQVRVRFKPATARSTGRLVIRRTAVTMCLIGIGAAMVTIVPGQLAAEPREPVPRFFTDGTWKQYVPPGYTVLSATPGNRIANMRWSVANNLAFGVPGGYFLGPDATGFARYGPVPRPTINLLKSAAAGRPHNDPSPAAIRQTIADLRYWRTAVIVLAPGAAYAGNILVTLDRLVGPAQYVDGVWIWDVRPLTTGPNATFSGVGGQAATVPPIGPR